MSNVFLTLDFEINKPSKIKSNKPRVITVKKTKVITNKVRRILSNPESYGNSVKIIYDTIPKFLDYYINFKLKGLDINLKEVIGVITDKYALVIKFNDNIVIHCDFGEHYSKSFYTLINNNKVAEWVIVDEEGISIDYEILTDFIED